MNSLQALMQSLIDATNKLQQAEEARDAFLEPILTILGATGGHIFSVCIDKGKLYVQRTGSCRGCRWDEEYAFPLAIFTARNPQEAATQYVAEQKKAKEEAARKEKLATIQRLQKEIGL